MQKFRKICILLAFFGLSVGAKAQVVDSGICGANLTWELTGSGSNLTLTISGTGAMTNYQYEYPWHSQRAIIKTLVMENGIITITRGAFGGLTGITEITIPESVTSISGFAFANCSI